MASLVLVKWFANASFMYTQRTVILQKYFASPQIDLNGFNDEITIISEMIEIVEYAKKCEASNESVKQDISKVSFSRNKLYYITI